MAVDEGDDGERERGTSSSTTTATTIIFRSLAFFCSNPVCVFSLLDITDACVCVQRERTSEKIPRQTLADIRLVYSIPSTILHCCQSFHMRTKDARRTRSSCTLYQIVVNPDDETIRQIFIFVRNDFDEEREKNNNPICLQMEILTIVNYYICTFWHAAVVGWSYQTGAQRTGFVCLSLVWKCIHVKCCSNRGIELERQTRISMSSSFSFFADKIISLGKTNPPFICIWIRPINWKSKTGTNHLNYRENNKLLGLFNRESAREKSSDFSDFWPWTRVEMFLFINDKKKEKEWKKKKTNECNEMCVCVFFTISLSHVMMTMFVFSDLLEQPLLFVFLSLAFSHSLASFACVLTFITCGWQWGR